jgi:glutamine amidotransferase
MIGVIDLDMGNLRSVMNAIQHCGFDATVVRSGADMADVTHLVLPGVGSYATAMSHVAERHLAEPIRAFSGKGKPVLGICLGMQLLSTSGEEGGGADGLGLVPGRVIRFEERAVPAVPHIGWNEARPCRSHPLFRQVKANADFYYVHSYRFVCDEDTDRLATVEYGGQDYASMVGRGSVVGTQFHPEKSQANGLRILENFCEWDGQC